MWKVIHGGINWHCESLEHALNFAKRTNQFVTITDGITEIVGKFGVDVIEDKVLPSGDSWLHELCAVYAPPCCGSPQHRGEPVGH